MSGHFLDLEQPLLARVRSLVEGLLPCGVAVMSAADYTHAGTLPTPSVLVYYDGFQTPTQRGELVMLDQEWVTVIAVDHAANAGRGMGARDDAGPLISALLQGLFRWVPPCGSGRGGMKLGPPVGPSYSKGKAYFPLIWTWSYQFISTHCKEP